MKRPKQIPRPQLENAVKLTALQLNALRPTDKHTVLTPELLKKTADNLPHNQTDTKKVH